MTIYCLKKYQQNGKIGVTEQVAQHTGNHKMTNLYSSGWSLTRIRGKLAEVSVCCLTNCSSVIHLAGESLGCSNALGLFTTALVYILHKQTSFSVLCRRKYLPEVRDTTASNYLNAYFRIAGILYTYIIHDNQCCCTLAVENCLVYVCRTVT